MDVFREADYEDELVSVSKTKKLRELWGNLGNVEENSRKERRLPPVCWGVVGGGGENIDKKSSGENKKEGKRNKR